VHSEPVLDRSPDDSDRGLDLALRPQSLDEFVGQPGLVANLRVAIQAARGRGEPLDHVLLSGLPGLGKTTLAHILAREMGSAVHVSSGPALARPGDLVGILTTLQPGDFLFIDEIHRLQPAVEEHLYSAMEDFRIDIVIDSGPHGRSVPVTVQRFTLVGATTREGMLSAPFRSRFGFLEKLELYPPSDLERIVRRSAAQLGCPFDDASVTAVARVSRGTPRVSNRLVKRLRDFAQVEGGGRVDAALAERVLRRLGIDEHGLVETDRKILEALQRGGGPVGLKTIAVAVGEDEETVEDVYEPFLLTEGWILRTPRGRRLTEQAVRFLEARRGPRSPGSPGGTLWG
jgi:Holliday junction DNA helicase RuvB